MVQLEMLKLLLESVNQSLNALLKKTSNLLYLTVAVTYIMDVLKL